MIRKQIGQWLCCVFLSFLLVVFGSTFIHSEQIHNGHSSAVLVAINDTVKSDRVLQPGDESGEVLKLQQQLRALGFYLGPTTSYYGETTTKAVRTFQQEQQLSPTGVVDTRTLKALSNAFDTQKKISLRLGDTGPRVAQLQQALGISQTGLYDSATEEAVRELHEKNDPIARWVYP